MLAGLLAVVCLPALEQNPTVNFRVQRLHATAEHFRPTGQVGYVAHRNCCFAQEPRRTPCRDNFDSERRELARKFDDASLVIHADERPLDGTVQTSSVSRAGSS